MSALYSALWESTELSLAAGRVRTRSAPGVRGGLKRQTLLLSQVNNCEKPENSSFVSQSQVLVANLEFMLAVQNQLGLLWTATLIASFDGSRLSWGSVWLQCWSFAPAAALVLLYPLCAGAGHFLCVVVPGVTLLWPSLLWACLLTRALEMWKKTMIPAPAFFEDFQSSGLQFVRESRLHESNNVLWPNKTNTKLPFSCEFYPDTTAEFRKNFLFIWKLVAWDLKWLLTLHLVTNSKSKANFESKDVRSYRSVCHKLNLAFKFTYSWVLPLQANQIIQPVGSRFGPYLQDSADVMITLARVQQLWQPLSLQIHSRGNGLPPSDTCSSGHLHWALQPARTSLFLLWTAGWLALARTNYSPSLE